MDVAIIAGLAIKIYALMTPTAVLSYFITHTRKFSSKERTGLAARTGIGIFLIGETLFLGGAKLFDIFGFTIDAFRIGVGLLLFLSAVRLMNGDDHSPAPGRGADIGIVPLAIPLGMGPSAIGWVMVLGSDIKNFQDIMIGSVCLFTASLAMFILLCFSELVWRTLGKTGLAIMAKLTALILSAIAAQVIFTGIRAFANR